MLLSGNHAIVHGAAGSIGRAVSHAVARHGASVQLAGRTAATLGDAAASIVAAGGQTSAQVDARDEQSAAAHIAAVVADAGSIDISVTAISLDEVQGIPLTELTLDDYTSPVIAAAEAHFLTARASSGDSTARRNRSHEPRSRRWGDGRSSSITSAERLRGQQMRYGSHITTRPNDWTPCDAAAPYRKSPRSGPRAMGERRSFSRRTRLAPWC